MIEVQLIDHMGSDLTVVNAARVSFDKESQWEEEPICWEAGDRVTWEGEWVLKKSDEGLIHYLAVHGHYSPFGHCFLSFRVTAPVFVARQLVKHEYLRMNEVSRRYVDTTPQFYTPDDWRERAVNKKQGSVGPLHPEAQRLVIEDREELLKAALLSYEYKLYMGVAPEQARMDLPQSMMTSWYWSGSLDAFANMYNLRAKEDAQYETRQVAKLIGELAAPLFPVSWRELCTGVIDLEPAEKTTTTYSVI